MTPEHHADLVSVLRERAARHDEDVVLYVLTVSSGMNALGVETLESEQDEHAVSGSLAAPTGAVRP